MNINDRALFYNDANQAVSNINKNISKEATDTSANSKIAGLTEGQMFQGEILDINNNNISISLNGKDVLMAKLADSININIGDSVNFIVKENNGHSVFIKPVSESINEMKNNAILNVLETNNFSPSEKNYQIAEQLMNNNMPVDKSSMQRIMQQSYKYPDTSISTIIDMNKMGIEVNEANIKQYEDYQNNQHQLTNDIAKLSNDIMDLMQHTYQSADSIEEIIKFNDKLFNIISDEADMSNILENNNSNPELINGNVDNISEIELLEEAVEHKLMTDIKKDNNFENSNLNNEILDNLKSELSDKIGLDKNNIDELFNELKKLGIDDNSIKQLSEKTESKMQLINNINALINSNEIDAELLKDFFSSHQFKTLLNDTVKEKMSIKADDMSEPQEINKLYKSLYEKTLKLMDAFNDSASGKPGQNLNESSKNLQERVDFIQTLNEMYSYAQIPVSISDNQLNSDLFVYMNKNKSKKANEEVSALLHLDMEHLGATDVHISLHGNTVNTRFYVDDEESAKIIDDHMNMLEKAINETGYQLTNEVITRQALEKTSGNMVVDKMMGNDIEQSIKRYSFDIRA